MLNIRDGTSVLLFSDGSTLLRSELDSFILSLATSHVDVSSCSCSALPAPSVFLLLGLCSFFILLFVFLQYNFILNKLLQQFYRPPDVQSPTIRVKAMHSSSLIIRVIKCRVSKWPSTGSFLTAHQHIKDHFVSYQMQKIWGKQHLAAVTEFTFLFLEAFIYRH